MENGNKKIKSDDTPYVSIVIPMRNEEEHIQNCIDSIFKNDYPNDKLEVLVIDGSSEDNSKKMVEKSISNGRKIRLFDNPRKIVPTAMNIGIREARGDIIIRMDAHALYPEKYIARCVQQLTANKADNVGGVQEAVGTNYISKAIAIATTNPFGVGDALYRYGREEQWVDTVFLGAWYKTTIEKLGGFNEEMVVNQDYEFNYRLRKAGGRILFSPEIRSHYFVRGSLTALMKQYFRYGCWRVKTLLLHPGSLRWRQITSPLFVLGLLLSLLLLPFSWKMALIIPVLYGVFNFVVTVNASRKNGIRYFPILPVIFFTIHVSWGLGFWVGIARFGVPKLSFRNIVNAFKNQY